MIKKVRDLTDKELRSICEKAPDCKECPLSDSDFYGESFACAIEIMRRTVEIK